MLDRWPICRPRAARSGEARLYDNADSDLPHREVALLAADLRWTAEQLPGWASAAIFRLTPTAAV